MIDFHRFFLNPFDDRDISQTEELKYAADHVQRMVASNPGNALDARIAATTAAVNALEGDVSMDMTKGAFQKARTMAKDDFRTKLPGNITKIYGAVVAAFGDHSPELMECFPQGRSIFKTCRDEELNNELQQLVNCITPKQAQVGAATVTLANTQLSTWNTLYTAQGTAKGVKSQTGDARNAARATLKLELFRNLLTIALMFPGDTAKCDLYCPQHLLRNPQAADTPGEATLSAGAWNPATQKVSLTMNAEGATAFELQRRTAGAPAFITIVPEIVADANGTATYQDTIAAGSYEYQTVPKKNSVPGDASNIVSVVAA